MALKHLFLALLLGWLVSPAAAQTTDPEYPPLLRFAERTAVEEGFPALRTTDLPEDDIEIRLWSGFGLFGTAGHVIRRREGTWTALLVDGRSWEGPEKEAHEVIVVDRQVADDWDERFDALIEMGMLDLPADPDPDRLFLDGFHYVLEVRIGSFYTAAGAPRWEDSELEADRLMLEVVRKIMDGISYAG